MFPSMTRPIRLVILSAFLLTTAARAESQTKDSPFLPAAGIATPTKAGPSEYELGGMSVVGKETLLSITRQSDKRSSWIQVGKTVGEITAVSYDPKKDEAVIRVDGCPMTLTMRRSAVVSGAPARLPTPAQPATVQPAAAAPVAPAPPMTAVEQKETEARMLVTDLLEIGQQQRKAYEEAQRQADKAGGAKPPAVPLPPASH
jgi:hypothetical protein